MDKATTCKNFEFFILTVEENSREIVKRACQAVGSLSETGMYKTWYMYSSFKNILKKICTAFLSNNVCC